ncbi:MAG: TIGR01906 family membrane protein [Anaerolineales bacterium]
MMEQGTNLRKVVQVVLSVTVLLLLLLTGVRLLLTNAFVQTEYNMPYFPADPYGMTKEQRQTYAPLAMEFLLNGADVSFLGDQTFDDGTPLYNMRELAHMVDVQKLTEKFLNVWVGSITVFSALLAWAWLGKWMPEFKSMLSKAGLVTIVALGTLILLIAISFDAVFVGFHRIFFSGDSWLFLYSDTLIRLFPERFWLDAFVLVGVFTFAGGLILWRVFRTKPVSLSSEE